MHPLIRFDRVSIMLGGKEILREVSFDLREGQKAVLCGKSGEGKTTLLKSLLGICRPDSGQILFQGQSLDHDAQRVIRLLAAYVGQEAILGAETVREALLLPFGFKTNRDRKPSEDEVGETFRRLGLPLQLLTQHSSRVSGGEKQRIAIARAQLLHKSLYLLDEVTSNLDRVSKQAVIDFFDDPKLTVLSVSHDPDWIDRCETVFELFDGTLTRRA